MTRKGFLSLDRSKALEKLIDIAKWNIENTKNHILYCQSSGIDGYRISSSILPLVSDPMISIDINQVFGLCSEEIDELKKVVYETPVKLSIHPSHFQTLVSNNPQAIINTAVELNAYGKFLNLIGCDEDHSCPINIHINTMVSTPEYTKKIFMENFNRLDNSVKSRLVLENNDKPNTFWNVENLLNYFGDHFPITFDNLHSSVFPSSSLSQEQEFFACVQTWSNYTPHFHFSCGTQENKRAHSEFANQKLPSFNYDGIIYWDFELKQKDRAIELYKATYEN